MSTALLQSSPPVSAFGVARLIASDIKLAHSVFALPFAVLASFLVGPSRGSPHGVWVEFAQKLGIVVLCMVFARTWAMVVNRLVDRGFDAENERTRRRVFASGKLSASAGWAAASFCAACFVGAASLFWLFFGNPWPMYLSVPVLAWIAFYSFTKRFTALCHVFLGGALAASPLAAAIAVEPSRLLGTPAVFYIAGFVLAWVAGFDVIYALQDQEFDRARGLSSIPAKLGTGGAIWVSRLLHAAAAGLLVGAFLHDARFGVIFGCAVVVVLGLLVLEHTIVAKRGKAGLDMAFFTVNGVVSCVLGVAGCVDILQG